LIGVESEKWGWDALHDFLGLAFTGKTHLLSPTAGVENGNVCHARSLRGHPLDEDIHVRQIFDIRESR
jgi:hypothetical protein